MYEKILQALEEKMNTSAGEAELASLEIRGTDGTRKIETSLHVIALELRAERHRKTFQRAYDGSKGRARAILEVPSE